MYKDNKIPFVNQEVMLLAVDDLCRKSIELIRYARHIAARQVNLVQLLTFYLLGWWIEEEMEGEEL